MARPARATYALAYQWCVVLAGAAALALVRPEWTREPDVLATLVILFALAEYLPTRVRVGAISFSFPMAYAAFLLYGPAGAVWVSAAGTFAANVARRRAWRVVAFNSTQFALAALVAGKLSLLWPGAPTLTHYLWPIFMYTLLYYGVNNLVVDLILWLRLKTYRYRDWLDKTRLESLSAAVGYTYCVLTLALAPQQRGHDPLTLIFFFLPLLTVGGFVRLLTNLSQFARQMETLLEVSTLATSAPDEPHALEKALSHLDAIDDYRYAAVYLMDGEELALRSLRGIPPEELAHPRIPVGEGLSGWAAREGRAAFAGVARQDPRNALGEGIRERAQMLAALPLVSGGQTLGVLTVAKERTHSIQPEDVRRLTIFANLLAAVIRNLHLAEERERLVLVQERNRLAREIHDGLAQSLAGALLQMDRLERLIETDSKGARRLLQHLREHIREDVLEVRRSIWGLRPPSLEAQGLAEALRHEVETLRTKGLLVSADVKVEVRGDQRRLSGLVEDEVFRIAEEGLTNALKHAGAREILIGLQFFPDRLRLTIRDDGKGFRLADAVRRSRDQGTFGLTGMSERAERLGAQFDVESRPGTGTRLILDVPLLGE